MAHANGCTVRPRARTVAARFVGSCVALGFAGCFGTGAIAHAQDDDPAPTTTVAAPTSTAPLGTAPVVVVPPACTRPEAPAIVFVGTLEDRDYRTGRFRVEQVRAGDESAFAVAGLIDVRYGNDVQYLEIDRPYLVAAGVHPDLGVLFSQIRAPAPAFGGDDVIGVEETETPCPVLDDPVRTLEVDGTSVESGVLTPLFEERSQLLGVVLVPIGIASAVILALAALRLLLNGIARGVGALSGRR